MYKLTLDENTILRLSDGAFIPRDPMNRDYEAFLEWEAGGGKPEPADPPPKPGPRFDVKAEIATLKKRVKALEPPT